MKHPECIILAAPLGIPIGYTSGCTLRSSILASNITPVRDQISRQKICANLAQMLKLFSMTISDQIRDLRETLGLTHRDVAVQAGCSPATVRAVETGHGTIRSMIATLAVLDAEVSWSSHRCRDDLGRWLAEERKRQKISQRSMATLIGVSLPTVLSLETKNSGRMVTLARYAAALCLNLRIVHAVAATRRLVPATNIAEADLVFTPRDLAKTIIDRLPLSGRVLDPCRGDGAFFDHYPAYVKALWCEIAEDRDFLRWQAPVNWIVTNPPWSKMRDFLRHAMTVSDNVVFLAALSHFTTKARVKDIRGAGFGVRSILLCPTPAGWPHSGFQIAAVWLEREWNGPTEITAIGPDAAYGRPSPV